jgi:hypothetical protein
MYVASEQVPLLRAAERQRSGPICVLYAAGDWPESAVWLGCTLKWCHHQWCVTVTCTRRCCVGDDDDVKKR